MSNDTQVKQETDRKEVLKVINAQVVASHNLNSDPHCFVINQNALADAFVDLLATVRREEREAAFKEAIDAVWALYHKSEVSESRWNAAITHARGAVERACVHGDCNRFAAPASPAALRDEAEGRQRAVRLLRKLREGTDPAEVERQKESWRQLEEDLSATPPPSTLARQAAEEIACAIERDQIPHHIEESEPFIAATIIERRFAAESEKEK